MKRSPYPVQSAGDARLTPAQEMWKRAATNAVREACEMRRGRLTPRALLAYRWLSRASRAREVLTLEWVCREMGWDVAYWRKHALAYVHRQWRKAAWRAFLRDMEARSRQVRALSEGGGDGYLPLVEPAFWHEVADEERPPRVRLKSAKALPGKLEFGEASKIGETQAP